VFMERSRRERWIVIHDHDLAVLDTSPRTGTTVAPGGVLRSVERARLLAEFVIRYDYTSTSLSLLDPLWTRECLVL
jgi:hypothetical protein